jgi:hypothetical protein
MSAAKIEEGVKATDPATFVAISLPPASIRSKPYAPNEIKHQTSNI